MAADNCSALIIKKTCVRQSVRKLMTFWTSYGFLTLMSENANHWWREWPYFLVTRVGARNAISSKKDQFFYISQPLSGNTSKLLFHFLLFYWGVSLPRYSLGWWGPRQEQCQTMLLGFPGWGGWWRRSCRGRCSRSWRWPWRTGRLLPPSLICFLNLGHKYSGP